MFQDFGDDDKVIGSYKNFYQNIALGNAFVSKAYVHESTMKKYLYTSLYASYYFFFKQKRLEQNDFFCANPDLDLAREIWNLLESKYIKKLFSSFLPNIKVNKKIYIPMTDVVFTTENIDTLPKFEGDPRSRQNDMCDGFKSKDRILRKHHKQKKALISHYLNENENDGT